MKKVLLVTYHFPPGAAIGGIRLAKFAEYLPEFGWEPIVLTVKAKYYDLSDSSPLTHPGLQRQVIRTAMLRNPSVYYRRLKRTWASARRSFYQSRSSAPIDNASTTPRLREWISGLLSFPDEQAGWVPFALVRGARRIRRDRIHLVMTSGPPHSVHLIGAGLSQAAGVPWVADLRDPWHDTTPDPFDRDSAALANLRGRLEAWFIRKAALVITTADRFTQRLRTRFPEHAQKITTIPNGYDLDEFSAIPGDKEKCFTITHAGSIYYGRDPEPLLHAVSALLDQHHIDPTRVRVRFVGASAPPAGPSLNRLITRLGLTGIVEVLPWLPRHQVLEMLARSHILLLLAEDQPLQIPAKVFDYLATPSHILAITGDGATADLLREVGSGTVVAPGHAQALRSALLELYTKYLTQSNGNTGASVRVPSPGYSRRHITKSLAGHLEDLL